MGGAGAGRVLWAHGTMAEHAARGKGTRLYHFSHLSPYFCRISETV